MTEAAPPPENRPAAVAGAVEVPESMQGPLRPPESFAIDWMQGLVGEDGAMSVEEMFRVREQLITVYGLERNGKSTERDRKKVSHRLGLLTLLVADDVNVVDQARSEEFAYDFVHLVWKEAETDNKAFDADKERQRLHELATHDPLTGLKNRRGLTYDLEEMIVHAQAGNYEGLALLYLDLDFFKLINDTKGLGHQVGDEVLTGVAKILQSRTRTPGKGGPADVVSRPHSDGGPERLATAPESKPEVSAEGDAHTGDDTEDRPEAESVRMGGDEFVLLLPYVESRRPGEEPKTLKQRTEDIAKRLSEAITQFMRGHTGNRIPGLGVSIGCVVWEEGMTADDFILEGDKAMYRIKHARKDHPAIS